MGAKLMKPVPHGEPYAGKLHVRFDEGAGVPDNKGRPALLYLGTNHRLSLAQNPVLLAGQIAILLASCNRDVARLRKRRQVAGREEVRAGDSESRTQFGRKPRAVRQPLQDVVRHLVTTLLQEPSCFLLLLIIDREPQEERAVGNAADQMAALVGLEVAQRPHGVHYTIISRNPTTRTTLIPDFQG